MTDQEKEYVDNLILNALTINTDEYEGQQVIDLNNLDLCAADYAQTSATYNKLEDESYDMNILSQLYSDPDIVKLLSSDNENITNLLDDIHIENNVILEFSEPTINDPNPLQYKIFVNPGDEINDNTIIGQVEQKGLMKNIKSIFSKGTVKGINDNTEYFHLYPSNCNRHIVLEDALIEKGNELDFSNNIQELNDSFTKEGILYALITNNMCQSLLPYILSRRYRGVYTRTFNGYNYSKWYLDSSDLVADNTEISTFIKNTQFKNNRQYDTFYFIYDIENEHHDTGLKIFDSSVLQVLDDIQSEFGANIIGNDITKADMKSWKKRAKKKRKRKKVKQEIKQRTTNSIDKIKRSENPYEVITKEKDRLLKVRENYINQILDIYKNKDKLPLCKYDPEYNDCKFLVQDKINEDVLKNVQTYDEDFSYYAIGDVDHYYNYYTSLLSNINLEIDNEYINEYYNLITDIINKRLIIETTEIKTLKRNFCRLFNDNISSDIFKFYQNDIFNTDEYIEHQFTKFENQIKIFVQKENTKHDNNIRDEFSKMELGEEAIQNAGKLYTESNKYKQICDYIQSLYTYNNDEDETVSNEIVSQLATLYMYIKSYGNGENNIYKEIKTENNKYIYLTLIQEEAQKIIDFWDKIILEYEKCSLNNCLKKLDELSSSFDDYADWPIPTPIMINNVEYQHYLFTNIYNKEKTVDISIGKYDFPETLDFPDIPEDITIDENWAIEQLSDHEVEEQKARTITFLDFEYWQKYFTLATLICLVPTYWNCGLDIMPYIQNIPLPCIFIAIKSLYIPFFNMIVVFGLAVRGMYPWPIILYINTSNQPISILTPLVAAVERLKIVFKQKINNLEQQPVQDLTNFYINKLNNEINNIKKENIKLENYKRAIKSLKLPKGVRIGKEFDTIAHPDMDIRQKVTRLEQLSKRSKAKL